MRNIFISQNRMLVRMILTALLLSFPASMVLAVNSYSHNILLSLKVKNETLQIVLDKIEAQSEYNFFYDPGQINVNRRVSVSITDENIFAVLDKLLEGTNLTYNVLDKNIVLSVKPEEKSRDAGSSGQAQQNSRSITGTITDATGEPIIGASIAVKGATHGTISGVDGKFSLSVPENAVLSVTHINYLPQEIQTADRNVFDIVMQENERVLSEVIVTALGIKREEKSLGYAVQKIGGNAVQAVKGTNLATSLTGKVAGLTIRNSTELLEDPSITLRGGTPLIVIDEIAYGNMKLQDISADDIESIDVLKGATASALYGARGANGAIMITTKKGQEGRLTVNISNNTMFNAGFLKIPEKQTSYASGQIRNGRLDYDADFVWGPYMDGSLVEQYDGISKTYKAMPLIARGKNNLKNFIRNSFVTTTNVNISQAGKAGSFRISANHSHTKGQFPNSQLRNYGLSAAGTIEYGRFKAAGNLSVGKRESPNLPERNQYGGGNIIYLMMVWTGADYDIRDFKDYWVKKDEKQNWPWTSWYDNPYFIANEHLYSTDRSIASGSANLSYDFGDYLKLQFKSGLDQYNNMFKTREAIGGRVYKTGYFGINQPSGWSFSNDFLVMSDLKLKDIKFELLGGIGSYYYVDYTFRASTRGGLTIPGFYSLQSSRERPDVSKTEYNRLMYSAYGKVGASYKSIAYLSLTGRNDWTSTLPSSGRSYFYPSASVSFLPSEIYNPIKDVLDFWKVRGSWTVSKNAPGVYETNTVYSISTNVWDDYTSASYPAKLTDPSKIKPRTLSSFEIGTDFRFFKGRLSLDYTYFRNREYNRIISAQVSGASGFNSMYVNTEEDRVQRGMEITIKGKPVVNDFFVWHAAFNLGFYHWYYNKFDDQYSAYDPRISKGSRADRYMIADWQKDPSGSLILSNGEPIRDPYASLLGYTDPKYVFGFTNYFKVGNFDIEFSIDGRVGGLMYAQTNQAMWNTGTHPDSDNEYRYNEVVNGQKYTAPGVKIVSGKLVADKYGNIISDDRVFAPNDVAVSYITYSKGYNGNAGTPRPQHVVNPSFIKFRELAINYNVPVRISQKIGCQKATVGFIGQNLWMWTKSKEFRYSDPDRGRDALNSPSVRLLGFNINLTF